MNHADPPSRAANGQRSANNDDPIVPIWIMSLPPNFSAAIPPGKTETVSP